MTTAVDPARAHAKKKPAAVPEPPEHERAALDAAIADLGTGARAWSLLTLGQRRALLRRVHATTAAVAEEWADVASTSKGLAPGHPLRGEEWLSGPYAALVAVDAYADTLGALDAGRSPITGVKTGTAPGGRTVVHTSPLTATDRLLLSGYSTEVWLEPGVTADAARRAAGLGQRHPSDSGGVGLVRRGNDFLHVSGQIAHHKIKLSSANGKRHGMETSRQGPRKHCRANRHKPTG